MSKKKNKKKAKKKTSNERHKPEGYSFGRPTKYNAKYCDEVITHMRSGLSFPSFAGPLSVSVATLYTWADKYPDFLEAKKIGEAKGLYWWETIGRAAVGGKVPGFQNATYIFTMKNKFNWRDRTEITGAGGGPIRIRDVSDLTDDEIDKELAALEEKGV